MSRSDETEDGAREGVGGRPSADQEQSREGRYARYMKVATAERYAADLRRAASVFNSRTKFRAGDLVQFKPMMHLYRYPAVNCPAVVVDPPDRPTDPREEGPAEPRDGHAARVFNLAISDESPYEDVFVGVLDEEYVFRIIKVASRRLERWHPAADQRD
jgi:hypothetical protein